jgi:hypothetical protein
MKVDCVGCGQYEHVVHRMPCGHDIAYYASNMATLVMALVVPSGSLTEIPCWCSCHRYYKDEK